MLKFQSGDNGGGDGDDNTVPVMLLLARCNNKDATGELQGPRYPEGNRAGNRRKSRRQEREREGRGEERGKEEGTLRKSLPGEEKRQGRKKAP